jgi:secreted trypsin-like serine protease
MLLLLNAALAGAPPPIVNGERTSDYPEVGLLYMTDRSGSYGAGCTGSVVADRWILTAAHCVTDSDGLNIKHVYVTFASTSAGAGNDEWIEAKAWYPHPDYNGRSYYDDIGLIEFGEDLDAPQMTLTEVGPKRSDLGTDFRLVGYGATSDDDTSYNLKKRMADVPLDDYDNALLYTWDREDGKNACHGDSGGPVLRLYDDGSYSEAGIIDFGSTCEGGGTGSARVDAYLEFLDEYGVEYTLHGEEGPAGADDDDDADDADGDDSGVVLAGGSGEHDDDTDGESYGIEDPTAKTCGIPVVAGLSAVAAAAGMVLRRR